MEVKVDVRDENIDGSRHIYKLVQQQYTAESSNDQSTLTLAINALNGKDALQSSALLTVR